MDFNIADIAREAGVSRATISRVMNGSPAVKAKTAARVRETIERLGYVRPAVRPGPKPKMNNPTRLRTGSIALITIGGSRNLFQEPIMAVLIDEIQAACRKRQLNLLLDQMTSPEQIPLCVETRQVDGAILMVSGRPANRRECISKLASLLPAVHLFAPGHPISSVDHVTVNDVAIGDIAFRSVKAAGCRSVALVNSSQEFLEALFVRGRAFTDRAALEGLPTRIFAVGNAAVDPAGFWPQPLSILENFSQVAETIGKMPEPVGVFLNLETDAPELHSALLQAGLLESQRAHLVIAGTTPHFVKDLTPPPTLIDLSFPEMINVAVDRLIHRANNLPPQPLTFLVPPRLATPE